MEKSVEAFRTISEVADDLDLPQHVLRFWETRFAQIRPLKRAGGRRYYRPADVHLLRNIRRLLYDEGYTIKGVQRLLRDKGSLGRRDEVDADVAHSEPPPLAGDELGSAKADEGQLEAPSPDNVAQDRACLAEALDAVESCERILRALLGPEPEGKRLQPDDGSL